MNVSSTHSISLDEHNTRLQEREDSAREYSILCAREHGWRSRKEDGEPIGWMYRELEARQSMISNQRILLAACHEASRRIAWAFPLAIAGAALLFFVLGVMLR